jgi:predicted transposase YdaD
MSIMPIERINVEIVRQAARDGQASNELLIERTAQALAIDVELVKQAVNASEAKKA